MDDANGFPRTTNDPRILNFGFDPSLLYMGMTYDQWCERYGAEALPVFELGNPEPVGFATNDLIDRYSKERRESWIVHYVCGMISGAGCLALVRALGWM